MYIETSMPRKPGDIARLISPVNPATDGRCLKFWYHMYGATVGSLTIGIRNNRGEDTAIETISGNFGNNWLLSQLDLVSETSFQVSVMMIYQEHVWSVGPLFIILVSSQDWWCFFVDKNRQNFFL